MIDPETELELNIRAIKYIDSLISKLSKAPKYKSELGQKQTLEIDELIRHLDSKRAQLNAKVNSLSDEIITMTEVIADATAED
ncbi:MAG: hypothetical protein J6Z11_12445 [Candidatus Riflebacteria bacterium]|nr:hypothetical protein [Candidatus Riflebacteria bacterium]